MKRRLILITTAAALALTGTAVAQRGPGGKEMAAMGGHMGAFGMLQHDANADGKLTRAEFDAALKARFNELDANRDGVATAEEHQAAMKARMEKAQADRFARIDTDKNGQISQAEMTAAGPGPGMGRPDGRRAGLGGPGVDRDGKRGERSAFGPMDADKDGRLTYAEFSARPIEGFTRADANSDGTVTISELQALKPGPR